MHALILSGSRNPQGMTARCANALAKGLAKAGTTSEMVFLPTLKIERCRQCEADGWGICLSQGRCIIEDDFAPLVEKIQPADLIVFATPVYFSDITESMRAFLDRLRRIVYRQNNKLLKSKAAIGICLAGSGGGGAPSACLSLEYILYRTGFSVIDVVPIKRQNIDKKVALLEKTGAWLATRPDIRPSFYSVRLGIATRWVYKVIAYLVYVRLGRWRH